LFPMTHSFHQMGSSRGKCCGSPFLIALEAGQTDVVAGVALRIVQSVNAELAAVFGGVAPQELDVAGCAAVTLLLLEGFDVLHAEVAPSLCSRVDALVGLELSADVFPGRGLVVGWWGWTISVGWRAAPRQLVQVPNAAHGDVSQVAPLEIQTFCGSSMVRPWLLCTIRA